MQKLFKENEKLVVGVVAFIVATGIVAYFFEQIIPATLSAAGYSSPSSAPSFLKSLVSVVVVSLLVASALIFRYLFKGAPLIVVLFLSQGFKAWAERTQEKISSDTELWNWLTDQVMVVQQRYAFSMGCIAFERRNGASDRVLLILRDFIEFPQKVYLWPGSRLRGVEHAINEEIKKIVRNETGCEINLVGYNREHKKVKSIDGKGNEIYNMFSPPPFLIMRQNRTQKNGVPGHIDLLYIAQITDNSRMTSNSYLIELSTIHKQKNEMEQEHSHSQLWPDTVDAIILAHQEFERAIRDEQHTVSQND